MRKQTNGMNLTTNKILLLFGLTAVIYGVVTVYNNRETVKQGSEILKHGEVVLNSMNSTVIASREEIGDKVESAMVESRDELGDKVESAMQATRDELGDRITNSIKNFGGKSIIRENSIKSPSSEIKALLVLNITTDYGIVLTIDGSYESFKKLMRYLNENGFKPANSEMESSLMLDYRDFFKKKFESSDKRKVLFFVAQNSKNDNFSESQVKTLIGGFRGDKFSLSVQPITVE